jgi:hypothetical protein
MLKAALRKAEMDRRTTGPLAVPKVETARISGFVEVDNMRLAVEPWKVPQLPVYEYY